MEAPVYNWQDFGALAPVLVLVLGACTLLLSEVFLRSRQRAYQPVLSAGFAALAGLAALSAVGTPVRELFAGFARADDFAAFSTAIICFALLLASLTSAANLREFGAERGEFHALGHLAAAGMALLVYSTDLIMFFVALETLSLATYALTAWFRHSHRPAEAGLKYFILGSFSSAILLYGAALLFGAAGSTRYAEIARVAADSGAPGFGLVVAGLALIGTGLLFKVAAVPFHMWAPDVYQGAPTPVTGFMAAGVKAAAVAAALRLVYTAFGADRLAFGVDGDAGWAFAISVVAVLTMLAGNLLALAQKSVKRMLAYSSISHAGYIGVAAAVGAQAGTQQVAVEAALFYLAAYAATAIGAFAVISAIERRTLPELDEDSRYDGLAERHPVLALAMAVFLLSLAGVPPTAGFTAKLFVFRAAVDGGAVALAVIGLLTSVIGLYYYLRVVVVMYFRPSPAGAPVATRSPAFTFGVALAAAATLFFGLGPGALLDYAGRAAADFGSTVSVIQRR